LLQEILLCLQKAKYFTKRDICRAYNLVRRVEGEERKTAFRAQYGFLECLVMPFSLTNAPASFQHVINDILGPYVDVCVIAYINDILIYSNNRNNHQNYVLKVLEVLSEAGLHLKPEKCHFHQEEVKYLSFIISISRTKIDPAKVVAI
jgi:hypothetical protein